MELLNTILAKRTEPLVVPYEIIREPHFVIEKLLRKEMKTPKLFSGFLAAEKWDGNNVT